MEIDGIVTLTEEGETLIITAPLDCTGWGECAVRLHRDEISVAMRVKGGNFGKWSIPGEEVTSVDILKMKGKKEAIYIITENNSRRLQIRLPQEGLEWLKNQILLMLVI